MKRPTCSVETAIEQAGMTVAQYADYAKKIIDQQGLPNDPAVMAALIQAQAIDFATTVTLAALYRISDSISEIACGMEK